MFLKNSAEFINFSYEFRTYIDILRTIYLISHVVSKRIQLILSNPTYASSVCSRFAGWLNQYIYKIRSIWPLSLYMYVSSYYFLGCQNMRVKSVLIYCSIIAKVFSWYCGLYSHFRRKLKCTWGTEWPDPTFLKIS